jgi:hypothetical protein
MARPYDPDRDPSYHPDDTPDLYLDDDRLQKLLAALPPTRDAAEIEARSVLLSVERTHRAQLRGEQAASATEPRERIEEFRRRFGYWPWDTDSARSFYEMLGN